MKKGSRQQWHCITAPSSSLQHSPHYSLSGHTVVQDRPEQPQFVIIWDNVSFHRAALVRTGSPTMIDLLHSTCHHIAHFWTEFFSAWHWKVYDRQPHAHDPVQVKSIHGWIRHARRYFHSSMSSNHSPTTPCSAEHYSCTMLLWIFFVLLLQKPEKQTKKSEVFPFCFHVSRSTVVDQSLHKKNLYVSVLKSKTNQSTEYSWFA